ncbi:MAG: DUF3568 family protein [Deltaproteobacteria bacterium]|nr:DUF3568 family protein [Deltaproteobacteria bacterium]
MKQRIKCIVMLAACIMCLGGCAVLAVFAVGAGAGVAGYGWYKGSLKVEYEAPFIETYDASVKTLEKMEMKLNTKEHKLTKGWVFARRAEDKEVRLTLKYISANRTEVDIRVGTFGDEESSNLIGEEIRKEIFKK